MSNAEDWTQQLGAFLETTARITETWLTQTVDTTLDAADAIAQEVDRQVGPTLDQWAGQVHETLEPLETTINTEAERMADEFATAIAPVVTPLVESLETWFDAVAAPVAQTVDPLVNDHFPASVAATITGRPTGGKCSCVPCTPTAPRKTNAPTGRARGPLRALHPKSYPALLAHPAGRALDAKRLLEE
jgi:hypothetical protein